MDVSKLIRHSDGMLYLAGTNTRVKVERRIKPIKYNVINGFVPSREELEEVISNSPYKRIRKANAYRLHQSKFGAWSGQFNCKILVYKIEDPIEFMDRQLKFEDF